MSESDIPLSSFVLEGRWRFHTQLGFGADGTVYLAKDEKTGERVAIKVYDSLVGRQAERIKAKIAEEASVSAGVDSPFLVRVIQWGMAPGEGGVDAGYMVMEFLEGETLREALERRVAPMPPAEALETMRLVLFAVNSLHRQGWVHCDLKPENVFVLAPHSAEARRIPVKVFDFGAARPVDSVEEGLGRGTPIYCAPEVAQRSPTLNFQSDVYSLGIMLYELLTGAPPLDARATPQQLVAQHVYGELDPLPEPLASSPINAIYRRATEKDADKRYRDAGAMLAALSALRPIDNKRLPSLSPFSVPAVTEDSVDMAVDAVGSGPADSPGAPSPPTRRGAPVASETGNYAVVSPRNSATGPVPMPQSGSYAPAPALLADDDDDLPMLYPEHLPSERGDEYISQGSTIGQIYPDEGVPIVDPPPPVVQGGPRSSSVSTDGMVPPAIPKK